MLLQIPKILTPEELGQAQSLLATALWTDGRATAGPQAAKVKNNQQLQPGSEVLVTLKSLVMRALERHGEFFAAALPKRIFPPNFNRYEGDTNFYGDHVDMAIRQIEDGQRVRTDLSCTLFLSEPDTYDGGELLIRDLQLSQKIKLRAGDIILYPGNSVHQVAPVTRGVRLASFFWIESMIRSHEQRRLLYEMDRSLRSLRGVAGDNPAMVALTGTYHNLLRMWGDS